MSKEVEHAYLHFWQPGKNVQVPDEDRADYDRYMLKASKHGNDYRMLLIALAFDANVITSYLGEDTLAMCYTGLETLAERIQRGKRKTQYLLKELAEWGEIEITACDGLCGYTSKTYRHAGTNHYYLPLPLGAQPWGRKTRGQMRRETKHQSGRGQKKK